MSILFWWFQVDEQTPFSTSTARRWSINMIFFKLTIDQMIQINWMQIHDATKNQFGKLCVFFLNEVAALFCFGTVIWLIFIINLLSNTWFYCALIFWQLTKKKKRPYFFTVTIGPTIEFSNPNRFNRICYTKYLHEKK